MERKKYTIDAANKSLGRLAAEIAIILRGKNQPDFMPNKDSGGVVLIKNIDKIRFTGNKSLNKIYYSHTGFMGGLKEIVLKDLFKKDPAEVLKRAVYGMLPTNKLRDQQIKRLKIINPVRN